MRELFEQISILKEEYDKKTKKRRFNMITALHKERDEVNLHSRIISYLLCPYSGHGIGNVYLNIFVRDILQLNEVQFDLNNISIVPNEINKTEYKEIDILIANKRTSQAIIIENKIDAQDSNNLNNIEGYKGQLERYYSMITTGKDNFGRPCEDYKSKYVYVYYLTMKNQPPGNTSVGILKNKPSSWGDSHVLSYDSNIREWLSKCLKITPDENSEVKFFIQHYSNLIDKMTYNDIPHDERISLKNIIANNIEDSKYLIDNFKHVKWHTVYEFWELLIDKLQISGYKDIEVFPNDGTDKGINNPLFIKTITEVTHLNILKLNYGVLFDLKNDHRAYISSLGRLSWGNQNLNKWSYFQMNIDFSDFSLNMTYDLIDTENMSSSIDLIINEIPYSESICYNHLTPIQQLTSS